jgi:hypothetical protein
MKSFLSYYLIRNPQKAPRKSQSTDRGKTSVKQRQTSCADIPEVPSDPDLAARVEGEENGCVRSMECNGDGGDCVDGKVNGKEDILHGGNAAVNGGNAAVNGGNAAVNEDAIANGKGDLVNDGDGLKHNKTNGVPVPSSIPEH